MKNLSKQKSIEPSGIGAGNEARALKEVGGEDRKPQRLMMSLQREFTAFEPLRPACAHSRAQSREAPRSSVRAGGRRRWQPQLLLGGGRLRENVHPMTATAKVFRADIRWCWRDGVTREFST